MKWKFAYHLTAILLSIAMFFPMLLVTAEESSNSVTSGNWQLPENFVDPVTLKIQEFKAQALDNEEISARLTELGMGWDPKTGARWLGRAMTTEEFANIPNRGPIKAPTEEKAASDGFIVDSQPDRTSCMRTSAASWKGVSCEMVSGSMGVASGQTLYHYLCMQLGNLDSGSNWVETVLSHNLGEAYSWRTYDSDEGYWIIHMNKNTPITSADTYTIMLDGTQDAYGWKYDIWINYQWVRTGHVSSLYNQAGFQKEVYSNSGGYTSDSSHAVFYRNWLQNSQGWVYWTNSVNTWWSTVSPVQESHSMGALSYRWETWV
jgi:hypothetical protein